MNNVAHCLAKSFLQYCIQYEQDNVVQGVPSQQWLIWLGGRKIVYNVHNSILYYVSKQELCEHLFEKGNVYHLGISKIDWNAISKAAGKNTHQDAIFWTKLSSGFLPTAQRLHIHDKEESNMCPCCENQVEKHF